MKDYFNLRTKSKILLLTLLAILAGGTSPAWADGKSLPYSYGFENNDLAAEGWTKAGSSIPTNTAITGDAKRSGDKGFQFWYSDNTPHYLISPELTTSEITLNLSFWHKDGYPSSYTETFNVGYSTSNSETESFTWLEATDIEASTSWTEYTKALPAGTKYVAIKYTAKGQYKLWIDDFLVEENETYPKPKNFEFTGYTATSASFTWTNGKDETAWQIAYATSTGFDADAATKADVSEKPYTLTGLTAETIYYARIRADYGSGNYSKWSDEISFKPSAATNTTVNDGSGSNGYVPFYGSYADTDGTMSQFITPSSSLTAIQNRQITKLTFYGTASLNFGTAKFKVYMKETDATSFADATFVWTDMDEVANTSVSTDSDGKMVIELESPFDYSDGNLMIGFKISATGDWKSTTWKGVSSGSAIYAYNGSSASATFLPKMTITSLPQVASVKKPKNLDDTAVATTTATLGWTNGSDETAWQIAYSTEADFDPDTEGTKVAADANPFTLTGLTAATTYYAYVRAKKAEEYSDWSNKADFTTLSATPVIDLSATSHNFGLVSDADKQALTLTISNTGGAALTGLTVTPSSGFAVTDAEGNALTATTIAASSSLTVKVKVNALGQQDGTITIDGNEIEAMQVTVSGYKLDDTKILETFESATSVSRWTVASGWTFNESTGAYAGTSSRTMTSPKLTVSEGNVLALNVKLGWSSGSLIVEGLDADGNTVYDPVTYNSSNGGLNTSNYTLLTISNMPTTVAKVKLTGYYAYINVFNGFTYVNDPVLGIFSNEGCTSTQASPATKNFGFATEAQEQKYYIKNTGNGQIDLTIEQADGFTAAVTDAALAEGKSTALTVTMTATEGLHDGTITVTAKNHDNDAVLGTFVVNVNGAVTGSKNNVVLSAFPAGWQNNNWTISNGAARNWSATSSDLITTTLTVTEGEKLLVEAYKYYSDEDSQLSYCYSTDGGSNWSDPVSLTSQLTTSYKIIAINGIPAGNVLMRFSGTYTYIRQIYGFEAFAEPIIEFAAAGTTKNFAMITAKTTSDAYTITNSGTALLDNLSVTCDNENFEIAVADNATSIAAGGNVTFTVALKTTSLGMQTGIVTISGTGVADKTLNVKGYVADGTKIFETFGSQPERWTNSGWTFSASGATTTSSSSKLESPKITIAEGQKLAISAMQRYSGSSYYVTINGSFDNGVTWTAYTKTLNNTQLNNTDYTVVELDDIPTTVNKLQLVGYYVYVNGLNGFTYNDNDPKFGVFSDSEFASEITTGTVTNAWGFVGEDKTATYYIKNTGTGTMTLSKTDAPAGFTATLGATSLGAGESTSLVISMANDATNNEGYHAGDVVLTAKDNADNTLGTFTVTSSGVVVGSKTDINFTTLSAFPAGWETTTWTVTENTKATVGYSTGTLTTGTYSVTAGEKMVVLAKKNASYGTLSYKTSTDGGANWSDATTITPSSTTDYELKVIEGISASDNVKIEFTGYYADIQRIYGFTALAKPAMTLSPAATSHDFGMQTAAADYEITVTNSGTAAMENLTAALSGTDAADFEVALSVPEGSTATITDGKANVPVGQTIKVTATMKASTEFKTHNATLTISADGLTDKVITLSGKTRDASKLFVDFDEVSLPATWDNEGWTVYNYGTDNYLYNSNSSTAYAVTTQALTVAEGESISFDVKAYSSYNSPYLTVRYSYNGGIDWTDFATYAYSDESLTTSFVTKTISGLNAGKVVLQFVGTYCGIDNIIGFTPKADEPTISVKKSSTTINNGATEAFGSIKNEATATYTIKNIGQGALTITSPITTVTGVATAAVDKTSLANGESATLTITMPVEAPYGDKSGEVTVKTSLGDFVINYNATILNPNALDEQFASGKPAGWYFGSDWSVTSGYAIQESNTASDLITEQLNVAGADDVLTFKVKKNSSQSNAAMTVAYSADRVNWTNCDVSGITLSTTYQPVTISGIPAGSYYLKINAKRVTVDNFLGWEKKNNTRDLYVTATSFPTFSGAEVTASATVTSLIAAEEGVYAKLFINDVQEGDATATQDIALNASKTFSMNYTMPTTPGAYKAQIKVYYNDNTEAFATAVKDYYVLDETVDPSTITAGTYDVKLTRTFNEGAWGTICLPFDVAVSTFNGTEVGADAAAYEFKGYDTTTKLLSFEKVTTLKAGNPYVIYTPSAIENLTLTGREVSATTAGKVEDNGVTFQGTYAPMAAGTMTGKYGITNKATIAPGTASASMKGFRAYFTDLPTGARLSFFDEHTGIKTVIAADEVNDGIFNMNGQKVQKAQKGLYIINGKKVIRK